MCFFLSSVFRFAQYMFQFSVILVSVLAATFVEIVEKYVFHDWSYLGFLISFVFIDTVLGITYAVKNNEATSKGFREVIPKIVSYACYLIFIHNLFSFEINNEKVMLFDFAHTTLYAIPIIAESISILENIGKINPRLPIQFILKKFKGFDSENGEYQRND